MRVVVALLGSSMPEGLWAEKEQALLALSQSSVTLLQTGDKPRLLEDICCNHQ